MDMPKTKKSDMIKALRAMSEDFDRRADECLDEREYWDWSIRARALDEIREEMESLINSLDEIRNVPLWDEYRCIEIANAALRDYK